MNQLTSVLICLPSQTISTVEPVSAGELLVKLNIAVSLAEIKIEISESVYQNDSTI